MPRKKLQHSKRTFDTLFFNRSCRLCGDYPLCEVINDIDIIILNIFVGMRDKKKNFLTLSELRKKLNERQITYRSITQDTIRSRLNKLVSLPFPLNFVIKKAKYVFTAPTINIHYSNDEKSYSNMKKIREIEGVIDYSFYNNSLKIYYNPNISVYSHILSSLYTILRFTPTKIHITNPSVNKDSNGYEKTTVYSLNPSNYSSIMSIDKINIQCPINLHNDCYKIIYQLTVLDKPVTIKYLSKKLKKGTRVTWDRIQDILSLGLLLKNESDEGPTFYRINPAHYLINNINDSFKPNVK